MSEVPLYHSHLARTVSHGRGAPPLYRGDVYSTIQEKIQVGAVLFAQNISAHFADDA